MLKDCTVCLKLLYNIFDIAISLVWQPWNALKIVVNVPILLSKHQ